MSNPENPSTWLPEPAANRAPNAVDWTDPGAPYVSSLAYRYRRDEHCTGVDVIKAQYAIDLEKRLRTALVRAEALERDLKQARKETSRAREEAKMLHKILYRRVTACARRNKRKGVA